MPDQQNIPSVLLLGESENHVALDKRALRDAGVSQIRVLTSGAQACRELAGIEPNLGFWPDCIVCSQKLEDMDGEQFCAILRMHPLLLGMPVLLLMPNDQEAEQLRALGCGASDLLARPYSSAVLLKHLAALTVNRPRQADLRRANRQVNTKAFDEALASFGLLLKPVRQPEDFFRVGMQCLQQRRWNNAIQAFQRALADVQIKGEAELGIAAAWKGKGDQTRFRAWLAKAAETFVQARRWQRACATYARLLREDPSAKNPFLAEAGKLIRQGQYDEASTVLAKGYELTPREQICERIARACLVADDPARLMQAFESGLEHNLGHSCAALNEEIESSLNTLRKEREEHRRQIAAERQMEISRQITEKKNETGSAPKPAQTAAAAKSAQATQSAKVQESAPKSAKVLCFDAGLTHAPAKSGGSGALQAGGQRRQAAGGTHWFEDDASADAAMLPILPPLTEDEATSGLFTGKPRLNELLSVVKCTWKLNSRNR